MTAQGQMQSLSSIEFIAMPPNPALNRTGQHTVRSCGASARPAD
jgi:hypothetical protein